jgi:hypothetical protein
MYPRTQYTPEIFKVKFNKKIIFASQNDTINFMVYEYSNRLWKY